jgi:hypothetical protein
MAFLAQLSLFCDQHGLLLLGVVRRMAGEAGKASFAVLLA